MHENPNIPQAIFSNAGQLDFYMSTTDSQLLDTIEAGVYLRTPKQTLVTWRCTGRVKIPYVKIGGSVRYRRSDLDAFVAANLRDAPDADGGSQ